MGTDVTGLPAPYRAKLGMARTYQKSRLFLGLTVEDNLYLAVLGVRKGHLRPVKSRARDGEMYERARARSPPPWASAPDRARSSARSRTASSASSRSAWRGRRRRS